MHRLAGRASLALLVLLLLAGFADAQTTREFKYYLNGGFAKVQKPDVMSDYHKSGYAVGGGIGTPLDTQGRLLARASLDYSAYEMDGEAFLADSVIPGAGATVSGGTAKIVHGGVNARAGLPADSKVIPYAVAGVGVVRVSIEDAYVDVPDSGIVLITSEPETKFAVNLGAGLEYAINEKLGITVEGQYRIGFLSEQRLRYIPLKVGIVFKQ